MENKLTTNNPVALAALMSETLFSTGDEVFPIVETVSAKTNTTTPPVAETVAREEFVYQGDRSTGILFILNYPDYPYFSPAAEEAFLKTIGALQLHAGNVAVLNLANPQNPNNWELIKAFFNPKKITLLGVDPSSLQLPYIAHNSYMKGNYATVFNTFSFEEMFDDVNKKKMFWSEFKTFIPS